MTAKEVKAAEQANHERFWKWMMVPLMDVPDEELIWCYKQDRENSITSKAGWRSELIRRGFDPYNV